jgi:hypothetical protein
MKGKEGYTTKEKGHGLCRALSKDSIAISISR